MSEIKWIDVLVDFGNGHIMQDAVRAENEEQALENAYWNWEDAVNIKVLSQ